jgi:hypothetical protein
VRPSRRRTPARGGRHGAQAEVEQDDVRLYTVPRELAEHNRVVAAQEARLDAARRRLDLIEVRAHGRVAIDRDQLPLPLEVGG